MIKSFLLQLSVLSIFTTVVVLTLHAFGLVSVKVPLFIGILLLAQLSLVILFFSNLVDFVRIPQNRLFVFVNLLFLITSLFYVLLATFFMFGSPFMYEDTLPNIRRIEYVTSDSSKLITFDYKGKVNNLGSISIPFKALADAEFESLSRDAGYYVTFSISQKDQEPFHTSRHHIIFEDRQDIYLHPFGFPVQYNSQAKTYKISLDFSEAGSVRFGTENGKLVASGTYIVPVRESISQLHTTLSIIWMKSAAVLQFELIYFILLVSVVMSLSVYIWIIYKSWFVLLKMLGMFSVLGWAVVQAAQYAGDWRVYEDFSLTFYYAVLLSVFFVISWLICNKKQIQANSDTLFLDSKALPFLKGFCTFFLKKEVFILVFGVVLAFALRVPHLEALDPYTDEYLHLVAARQLVEGTPLHEVYDRSLYIVTLPVAVAFQFFGFELWVARSVGVFFNVLSLFPLYFILRRFGLVTAAIGVFLFATNPWLIAVSRNVREYAYYPFYFYSALYCMVLLYNQIPYKWNIFSFFKAISNLVSLLLISVLGLVAFFFLYIDPLSTGKVLLIAYVVFLGLVVTKVHWKHVPTIIFLAISILIGLVTLVWFGIHQHFVSIIPVFNTYWTRFFMFSASGQWYYQLVPFAFMVFPVFAFVYSFLVRKRTGLLLFFCALFLAYWYFYIFHFDRYSRPRYGMSIQFWYVLVMAVGLGGMWQLIRSSVRSIRIQSVLAVSILLITWNPFQSLLPMQMNKHGYVPITNEYHDDVRTVHEFMKENVQEGDVLVHTIYHNYAYWKGDLIFRDNFSFGYRSHTFEDIELFMSEYQRGWVVLDYRRGRLWSRPITSEILSENKNLEYIKTLNGMSVYQWEK